MKYNSYQQFLHSDYWKRKKKLTKNFYKGKECFICGSVKNIQTHHTTYTRIGEESPTDLVFLCGRHHERIHEYAQRNNLNIYNATYKYKKEYKKSNGLKWGKYEIAMYFQRGIIPSIK